MRSIARVLAVFCLLISSAAFAQPYSYGPAKVTLYGTLVSMLGETPDGVEFTYPALRLATPITVDALPGEDAFDPTVEDVLVLHLVLDKGTREQFKQLQGRLVAATGTLFHADNGHHQTDVLLSVSALLVAR